MLKKYLDIGKVVGVHGIRGDVKIEPWCDSAEFLCNFKILYNKDGSQYMEVKSSKVHKRIVIVSFKGIDTIEQASKLIGKVLYINREDAKLDEGTYFIQDIIGLSVIDYDTKKKYGEVINVLKTGANDVYQILSDNGKEYLIPVIDSVVLKIDILGESIYIRPIKGIFEDED